jgi:FkbM family methyltransferase
MLKKWTHYAGRVVDRFVAPLVPPSYRLAFQFQKYTMLLGWEPEVLQIQNYARRSALAIDVGANMGLWSYAMTKSGMFKKVLAFEPNPTLTRDLSNAGFNNVTVIHKAVSSEPSTSLLKIPKQGKALLSGWASLENHIDLDTDEFQEMLVETIRLDDFKLDGVGFIKIDVEGHELNVLGGARNFFTANRPVCLIECRDRNKRQVEEFFDGLHVGYREVDTAARFGFELSPGNVMFGAE